jgi:hypothetical protein
MILRSPVCCYGAVSPSFSKYSRQSLYMRRGKYSGSFHSDMCFSVTVSFADNLSFSKNRQYSVR